MNKKKDLFSLVAEIDIACVSLEELALLLDLLDGEMEAGYQTEESPLPEWKVKTFMQTLPVRLALLRTIQREFRTQLDSLEAVIDPLMKLHAAQKALVSA